MTGPGIGARRVGPFTLLAERDRDEVGTLWEARDERTGVAVDLRLLPAGLARNNLVHVRFLRDAARAATVDHPSVVRVLESGEAGGELFLAAAPAPGRTLQSLLEEARGTAPPDGTAPLPGEGKDGFARAAAFFRSLALALQAVHDAGLVHGRLDPRRVLVLPDGSPAVRDLGLPGAGLLGEISVDRSPLRATPWSAPESLDPTELLEPRADVYSLGALLYQCLALRPPHDEATSEGLAWRLRTSDPVPLRRWNPAVPPALARVVANAMARDRGPRYRSARDFAADLGLFLEGKRVGIRTEPLPGRLVRWPVRHPVLVFNLLLLAMAVEAVVLLWGASIPMARLAKRNGELEAQHGADTRRLEAVSRAEGWQNLQRALEPILEASRDVEDSDPDLALLFARFALERAREAAARDTPEGAAFRRRARDRVRECLLSNRLLARTPATGRPAPFLAAAEDGSGIFAAGSEDGTVRVFNAEGRLRGAGTSHRGPLRSLRAAPGGALFVTASEDGTARTWGSDGSEIAVYAGHDAPLNAAACSRDQRWVLTGSDDGTALLWRSNGTRAAVLAGHDGPVLDVAFDGDGEGPLTASADGTARAWTPSGEPRLTLRGHEGPVRRILPWSGGGAAWLTLSDDGTVRTWSASGAPLLVLRHGGTPTCFADGGDGRLVTGAEDGVLRVWDAAGALVASIPVPGAAVRGVDRSPETGLLLAAATDGSVHLFTEAGSEVDRFSLPAGGAALGGGFAPGGEVVRGAFASGSVAAWRRVGADLGSWRVDPGEVVVAFERPVSPWRSRRTYTATRSDPSLLVLGGERDGRRFLFRASPGMPAERGEALTGHLTAMDASETAGARVVGGGDGTVRRSAGGSRPRGFGDPGPAATAVEAASDGSVLAGYADGTIRHWTVDSATRGGPRTVGSARGSPVRAVSFDPDSDQVAWGTEDGAFGVARGTAEQRFALGHPVARVAWNRDPQGGSRLLVVARDGSFTLLDGRRRPSGKERFRLPEGGVLAAEAADDGSFLALTDSGGGSCRVWRIDPSKNLVERVAVLLGSSVPASGALEGGGGTGRWRAATASADGGVRLFALDEQGLLQSARNRLPREITDEERARFAHLSLRAPSPPRKGRTR